MEASKLDGKRGGFRRFIAMNTAGLITGKGCGNRDLQGYKKETTEDTGVAADSHLACTHTQAVCDYCLSNNQEETTNIALVTKGDDTNEPFDLDLSPPPPPPPSHNFHRLSNHRSKPDVDDIKKLPQPNSPIHPGVHLPYYVTPHGSCDSFSRPYARSMCLELQRIHRNNRKQPLVSPPPPEIDPRGESKEEEGKAKSQHVFL
ncbi:unnamed protein product, partial [Brassica oleracea]